MLWNEHCIGRNLYFLSGQKTGHNEYIYYVLNIIKTIFLQNWNLPFLSTFSSTFTFFLRKKKTDSKSRNRRCEHRPPQEAGRKAVERGIVGHLPISSLVIHAGKALLRRNAFSQVEKGWRCFGCLVAGLPRVLLGKDQKESGRAKRWKTTAGNKKKRGGWLSKMSERRRKRKRGRKRRFWWWWWCWGYNRWFKEK